MPKKIIDRQTIYGKSIQEVHDIMKELTKEGWEPVGKTKLDLSGDVPRWKHLIVKREE